MYDARSYDARCTMHDELTVLHRLMELVVDRLTELDFFDIVGLFDIADDVELDIVRRE